VSCIALSVDIPLSRENITVCLRVVALCVKNTALGEQK